MKAKEILGLLDKCSENFDFPVLGNVGQCKLTVFSDKKQWLLVFEIVAVDRKQDISNDIYIYSNVIKENGLIIGIDDIVSLANKEWWYDDEGNFVVNPFHLNLFIKEELVTLTPTPEEYIQLGIKAEPFNPTKLLRYLSFKHGEKLWLSVQELLDEIGENITIPLFYQTQEWEHPDIIDNQKPSEIVFFQSLAQAIEFNDVDLIKPGTSNTHWSNWTWSDFENLEED